MQRNGKSVLIIVQNLPVPFDRRVWQEATSLQKAGFDVAVICPKKKVYKKSYERLENIDIYRYALPFEANSGVIGYFIEFIYCWLATAFLSVKAYFHRPFHVIHACNPPDTYFALALLYRLLGVKFVFDHHDLCPEMYVAKGRPKSGLLYHGLLWLERRTLRSADMVIAVNRSHFDIAVQRGGISPDKVAIVRSGPRRAWSDLACANEALKQGRRFLVMYLGEMCEQDGVDSLLRSIGHFKQFPEAAETLFVFVGGGPDQPRLVEMAKTMGLAGYTHFTGRVSDEDLWGYLSTADVCADPDPLTEWSNLSTMNKMIEYLAFGRPTVAYTLLEHRNTAGEAAVFVEANNEQAMAEAIRELLEDGDRRMTLSSAGRQRFRDLLAWENSEKELIRRYEKLLGVSRSVQQDSTVAEGVVS